MKKTKEKICVVLTGGTICSVPDKRGKNQSDAAKTSTRLEEYFLKCSDSPYIDDVTFDYKSLTPDILSENMTVNAWNDIIKVFGSIAFDDYKGIIVLHGTDTLAYTSSFLSFALAGIKIPVCMVSAQLRLGQVVENNEWEIENDTNGYVNFCAAVELIMNGIEPNVYAVYRNEASEYSVNHKSGAFLVHYGSHLLQCPNSSNNFHSRNEMLIPDTTNAKLKGREWGSNECLYKRVDEIKNEVLMIKPYTNFDYSSINLKGIKTVIHGTYHSESVCIGRPAPEYRVKPERDDYTLDEIIEADRPCSILYLIKECCDKNIPLILAPCDKNNAKYGTTANACNAGALPIGNSNVTLEAIYAKAVLGCALGKVGAELVDFLRKELNYEFSCD